jgi:hypothetical protein
VILFAVLCAACFLQAVTIFQLLDAIQGVRGQVCHLAMLEHAALTGCTRP